MPRYAILTLFFLLIPFIVVTTFDRASAAPAVSFKGGWSPTSWEEMTSRGVAHLNVSLPLSPRMSVNLGAGYMRYDWTAGVAPACVDCTWEMKRNAAFIPLSAGIRLDLARQTENVTAPYLTLAPAINLFRLSRTHHRFNDRLGTYADENKRIGAEFGFEVESGIHFPVMKNGSGLEIGVRYLHSFSPGHTVFTSEPGPDNWTSSGIRGTSFDTAVNVVSVVAGLRLR